MGTGTVKNDKNAEIAPRLKEMQGAYKTYTESDL